MKILSKDVLNIPTTFLKAYAHQYELIYQNQTRLFKKDLDCPHNQDLGLLIPYGVYSFFLDKDDDVIYITSEGNLVVKNVCLGPLQGFEKACRVQANTSLGIIAVVYWKTGIKYTLHIKTFELEDVLCLDDIFDVEISKNCEVIFFRKGGVCYTYNTRLDVIRSIRNSDSNCYNASVSDDGTLVVFTNNNQVYMHHVRTEYTVVLHTPIFIKAHISYDNKYIVFAYGINYFKIFDVINEREYDIPHFTMDVQFVDPLNSSLVAYNYDVGWTLIKIDIHRKKNKMLMLCARSRCEDNLFYKENFPLDVFKLVYNLI